MANKTKKTNQQIVNETIELLNSSKGEWEKKYEEHATYILKNIEKYEMNGKKFQVNFPLSAYTSISKIKKSTTEYDIRFLGQSIGTLSVKADDEKNFQRVFSASEGLNDLKNKRNILSLPDITDVQKVDWESQIMTKVRSVLQNSVVASTKSPEHKCENLLLREFNKNKSDIKGLCNIQPVKLANKFIQITTPLSASKHNDVHISNGVGGGIDILARVKHKGRKASETFLSVIELKDDNRSNEPMSVVIQQALSYATFLAMLLGSKSGHDWWKIFGFNGKTEPPHEIDVVGLMPKGDTESIACETFEVGEGEKKFTLNIYTLYFDKDALLNRNAVEFSGSYTDVLLPIK